MHVFPWLLLDPLCAWAERTWRTLGPCTIPDRQTGLIDLGFPLILMGSEKHFSYFRDPSTRRSSASYTARKRFFARATRFEHRLTTPSWLMPVVSVFAPFAPRKYHHGRVDPTRRARRQGLLPEPQRPDHLVGPPRGRGEAQAIQAPQHQRRGRRVCSPTAGSTFPRRQVCPS